MLIKNSLKKIFFMQIFLGWILLSGICLSNNNKIDNSDAYKNSSDFQTVKVNLSGTWNFTPLGEPQDTHIVPGFYVWKKAATKSFYFKAEEKDPFKIIEGHPEVDYERTFDIPFSMIGKKIFLRFESVNFLSNIYINGEFAETHIGGYLPFEVNITPFVEIPSQNNTIKVEIRYWNKKFLHTYLERPFWPVGFFDNFWYLGITGDVSLIARESVYIDDIFIQTSVRKKEITVDVSLINTENISQTVDLSVFVRDINSQTQLTFNPEQITIAGLDTVTVNQVKSWQSPQLWSPAHPTLYDLKAEIKRNGFKIDSEKTRFGFREFWIEGKYFYLNGIRKNLRGDIFGNAKKFLQYCDFDSSTVSAMIDSMLSLNFNVIRTHTAPVFPWVLNICDSKGMLVINESAIYSQQTIPNHSSTYVKNGRIWQKEWIKRDRNHPSIIIWSAENELIRCGIQRFTISEIKSFGDAITEIDNTRPIIFEGDNDLSGRADIYSYHYIYGFPSGWPTGSIYDLENYVEPDKPTSYGEFEWKIIASSDWIKLQCIKLRVARIVGFADIRPFKLDWALFSEIEFFNEVYDGWIPNDEDIALLKKSMNPVAVFDRKYLNRNKKLIPPEFNESDIITRKLVIFNDEMNNLEVEVRWKVLIDGTIRNKGNFVESIPLGHNIEREIEFLAPYVSQYKKKFTLEISSWKNDTLRYYEELLFRSIDTGISEIPPEAPEDVNIMLIDTDTIELSWEGVNSNTEGQTTFISHYIIYKSRDCLFRSENTDTINTNNTKYIDALPDYIKNSQENIFYCIKAVDYYGLLSQKSNIVGEFDLSLSALSSTDFNNFSIPVREENISDAQEFLEKIPSANSIAQWVASYQSYRQYIPAVQGSNFPLEIGYPYLINAVRDTVITFFGKIAQPNFNLITTSTTNFNTIILPLHKADIEVASELLVDIPHCISIARWDENSQGYIQYVPDLSYTDFSLKAGYPYFIEVNKNVSWPQDGMPKNNSLIIPEKYLNKLIHAPHTVFGPVLFNNGYNFEGGISFESYIKTRPEEILTDKSFGCYLQNEYWSVQCGNFPSGWTADDTLIVKLENKANNSETLFQIKFTYKGADRADRDNIYFSQDAIPEEFDMEQNVPNPFNSQTLINYRLSEECRVEIVVYNTLGQKISTLVDEVKDCGSHSARWNGCDKQGKHLGSGFYIIRMKTEKYTECLKALLIR